jgi:hypothetical protein
MRHRLSKIALVGFCCAGTLAVSQQLPRMASMTPSAAYAAPSGSGFSTINTIAYLPPAPSLSVPVFAFQPVLIKPAAQPCAKFVEPFDVDDYSGPMSKVISHISQRVDSATVKPQHRHSLKPCAMDAHDKFQLFLQNSADPLSFMGAAWNAGTAQLGHDDKAYHMGAAGFGKRYSAAVTDNITGEFFSTFLYPSLFHQDPRYYRQGAGGFKSRLGHALIHRFISQSDLGVRMPNYSEWFGTASSTALSNLYHPGNLRGFGPSASRVSFSVGNDMAWDVLREFWPEVAHKLHLPFRTHQEVATAPVNPVIRDSASQGAPGYPGSSFR